MHFGSMDATQRLWAQQRRRSIRYTLRLAAKQEKQIETNRQVQTLTQKIDAKEMLHDN